MLPLIRSTWLSGFRGRSFQMVFALGLLLVGVAYLASMFSPRQPQTVALDVGLSGLRFALVLQVLFWVQELVGREIERKTVTLVLSYPVRRSRYVLGRFLGIALLLLTATMMLAMLLWLVVLISDRDYPAARHVALGLPYWMSVFALYCDVLVVLAFALCLASLSTVTMLPLALGSVFAIVGRSIGAVMDFVLVRGADGDAELADRFGPVLQVVGRLLPDLSRLDWRDWPLYNLSPDYSAMGWSLVMAAAYAMLLLALAVLAFNRREFA